MASYSGIYSGQSFSGQNTVDQSIHNHYLSMPVIYTGIDLLLEASEPDAAVDAEARAYAPQCFPGTREQYIDNIAKWTLESGSGGSQSLLTYWMYGPAGVGKSAIAQICAELAKDAGLLGAAFFFSINGRNDHTRFFSTIAFQLSTALPNYKKNLNDVVLNNKTILKKTIASQFKILILEPLQGLKEVRRKTIFIDGIDECRSTSAQRQIIELITISVRDCTTLFRWAFFSRPEVHIAATFGLDYIRPLCTSVILPISRDIDGEIRLYLEGGFKNILSWQSISFSLPWPAPDAIQKLVDASAGLYAYPATVLHFINSYPAGGPKKALAVILDMISHSDCRAGPLSPFVELDAFYVLIMQQIPDNILPSIKPLFVAMVECRFAANSTVPFHIAPLFNRLRLSEAELNDIHKHLHVVIHLQNPTATVPLDADIDMTRPYYEQQANQEKVATCSSSGKLAFHHKSFYDFLADPTRSARLI